MIERLHFFTLFELVETVLMAPDISTIVIRKLSTVTIMVPICQVNVFGRFVFLEPAESLRRYSGIDQECRVICSNVVGMDVLFDSLVERDPMEDTRKDFLHNYPFIVSLLKIPIMLTKCLRWKGLHPASLTLQATPLPRPLPTHDAQA